MCARDGTKLLHGFVGAPQVKYILWNFGSNAQLCASLCNVANISQLCTPSHVKPCFIYDSKWSNYNNDRPVMS